MSYRGKFKTELHKTQAENTLHSEKISNLSAYANLKLVPQNPKINSLDTFYDSLISYA